jgi:hypothetical protein
MNEEQPSRHAVDAIFTWLRIGALTALLLATMQFLAIISWGATNIPLLTLLSFALVVMLGFAYIAFGIILGIVLGWMLSLGRFFRNCVRRFWESMVFGSPQG